MFTKIRRVALIALVVVSSATLATGSLLAASSSARAAGYIFTSIDVPAASQTFATGINNAGQIVGYFVGSTGVSGFVKSVDGFEQIVVAGYIVQPSGINDVGQIVGSLCCGMIARETIEFGFLRDTDGAISTLPILAKRNFAKGINNAEQIVGYFHTPPIGPGRGFLYSDGGFTNINPPGVDGTRPWGINSAEQIVGAFYTLAGGLHGFLYSSGTFTTIDVPGVDFTFATGINNVGQIVGYFHDFASAYHGFIFSDGSFTQIDVPFVGATRISVLGINDGGQIVGSYYDATGNAHGFLADPVPPFAGTPAEANCYGESVSALARQFGGLKSAADALEFASAQTLQDAIREFCGG